MTQAGVSLGQRAQAVHVRVNLGPTADFDQVIGQLVPLRDLTRFVERVLAPPELLELMADAPGVSLTQSETDREAADILAQAVAILRRRIEATGEVSVASRKRLDMLSRENPVWVVGGLMQPPVDPFGLKLGGLTFQNPLDVWVHEVAPVIGDWRVQSTAALLLLRGLMKTIRYWQHTGDDHELRDLEIRERRARVETIEWEQRRIRQGGTDAAERTGDPRRRLEVVSTGTENGRREQLVKLLGSAAHDEAEQADDDLVGFALEAIGDNPEAAVSRVGSPISGVAGRALTAVGEVVDATLEEPGN